MEILTNREIGYLDNINTETEKMKLGTKVQEIIEAVNIAEGEQGPVGPAGPAGEQGPAGLIGIPEGTPVNAVNATKVLSIDGVVIDGETMTTDNAEVEGADIYEFAADIALSVGAGNIAVDINDVTVKATDDLTIDTNPTPGDTMTIGTKVFTFVPNGTGNADGEIDVEALLADTQINIIAAIKGTDGHNDPHPLVTCGEAFALDILAITAFIGGVAGNAIATTETFAAETNIFSAATLQTGEDCSATDAVTALVAAITASDTQGVGAVDGEGDTIELTSDIAGVIGNGIAIDEDMANGAFAGGAVALSGGVDGTIGSDGETMKDATYLYISILENTISNKNWRRHAHGAAY